MGRKTFLERLEREREVCLKSEKREKERERERFFAKLCIFFDILDPLLDHTRCDHCNLMEMRETQQKYFTPFYADFP